MENRQSIIMESVQNMLTGKINRKITVIFGAVFVKGAGYGGFAILESETLVEFNPLHVCLPTNSI